MLSVVQRAITDSGYGLPKDKQRIAVQIVCSGTSHDHRACKMEVRQDHSKQRTTPFVDSKP